MRAQPPRALRAHLLEMNGDRYAVFEWPLDEREGWNALTVAELEIVELLRQGLKDREIALRRGRTRSTVTKQIDSVFRKLGVQSRRELAARDSG
jgi:DNA-binding NarL/FixJ family response regulator